MSKPEVIIALDLPSKQAVDKFVDKFPANEPLYLKVGMELYYKEGSSIIKHLKSKGHRIFLDLKMHDIPNTIRSAMRSIAALGVDLTNLHAAGGTLMMKAGVVGLAEGTQAGCERPLIIAVTQLTSTSKKVMNKELGIPGEVADSALNYAQLAKDSGLDGVVCSAYEVRRIHETCGADFITLTPGIRLKGDEIHEQTRIATPSFAKAAGSNYIVIGRSITQAEEPYEVYKRVHAELA